MATSLHLRRRRSHWMRKNRVCQTIHPTCGRHGHPCSHKNYLELWGVAVGISAFAGKGVFCARSAWAPSLQPRIPIGGDWRSNARCGSAYQQLFTKGSHHRNLSVIYIVQNLFDQHKEHRTIPDRSFSQADVSGRNPLHSSSLCTGDTKASRISCDWFETDHSRRDEVTKSYFPQWSTGSLCGRYIRAGKRIRAHWMSRRRRVHIGMTSRVKRQAPLLLALAKAHPHVCKAILRGANQDLLQCLSECALNILKGNVTLKPSEKARLTKYRQKLRKVADKKVSLKQKHKIVQTGGFAPALLAPLLAPLIAPLANMLWGD